MHQSTAGERLTAAISTVVAIAILGAAVTAQQARTPHNDRLASLESDLRFQLDLAFRHDRLAYRDRIDELEHTLQAWRTSPRSSGDDRLLVDWLRASIVAALPGRSGKLPPAPAFGGQPPSIVATPPSEPAAPPEPTPSPALAEPEVQALDETPPVVVADVLAVVLDAEVQEVGGAAAAPVEPLVTADTSAPPEHSITVAPAAAPTTPAPASGDDEPPAPVVIATTATATDPGPTGAAAPVRLNLAELNARIGGYHQGLAEVEAAVVAGGELTGGRLARLVTQLEQLAGQYQFVRLYYDALTVKERRFVAAPRAMDETVELVERHVAGATGDDFLNDFDAAHADEPTLSERLRAVANAVSDAGHNER